VPLGTILLEKKMLTPDQLDEALNIHWRRGILFGEVLKELGFIKEEELHEALREQYSSKHHPAHPKIILDK